MNFRCNLSRCKPSCVLLAMMAAVFGCAFLLGKPAAAQTDSRDQLRLLTAFGESEVRVRPDLVEIRLGVDSEAPTAAQAREENAARAGRVVAAIKALGVPETAIQTSTFQIHPVRRFEDREYRGEPPIVGYSVVNIVSVRTEKFDLAPKIIDDSVGAGANRVDSVGFMLKDEATARQKALQQAVANARTNALAMAKALDVVLVKVQTVQQGGVGVIRPPVLFRAAAEVAAPTPILPGEVTVNASVTLTYVIK